MALISVREAAAETGIGVWQFHHWIRSGAIPPGVCVHLGPRRVFLVRERWAEFLANGGCRLTTANKPTKTKRGMN
jgi:predicted DNA-binding transcriptional regulator AlpA